MYQFAGRTLYEAHEMPGFAGRSTPEPIVGAQLGIAPILTSFLMTTAVQQQAFAGPRLFPDLSVPAARVTIVQTQGEALVSRDTIRAYLAEMRMATARATTFTASLRRRTFGSPVDDDEVNNQNFLNKAQQAILLARAAVDLSIEVDRADRLVANAGNFATTIALSSGWAAAGTMYANIQTAIAAISNVTGLAREQLTLALLGVGASNAARSDATFLTKRTYTAGTPYPTLDAVRDYLGIGSIWTASPVVKRTEEAAATQLYADQAILYYEGDPALLGGGSDQVGGIAWGRNLSWAGGNGALSPFRNDMRTATVYPFQRWEGSTVFDNRVAVKITGISL